MRLLIKFQWKLEDSRLGKKTRLKWSISAGYQFSGAAMVRQRSTATEWKASGQWSQPAAQWTAHWQEFCSTVPWLQFPGHASHLNAKLGEWHQKNAVRSWSSANSDTADRCVEDSLRQSWSPICVLCACKYTLKYVRIEWSWLKPGAKRPTCPLLGVK